MEFDKIDKDNGFYSLKSLEKYFFIRTDNTNYTRYAYSQKKPFGDIKEMIEKLGGEVFKTNEKRLKSINPILVYFVSCASLNTDLKQGIEFYKDMLKCGIDIKDSDLEILNTIMDYGSANGLYDFEILFMYLCILVAHKEKIAFEVNDKNLGKLIQNFNRYRDVQNRIYNTLKTRDNYTYFIDCIKVIGKGEQNGN